MESVESTNIILDSLTATKMLELLPLTITEVLQKEFRGLTTEDGLTLIWMILTDQEIAVSDIKLKTKSFISWNLGKIDARDGNFYLKTEVVGALKIKILNYLDTHK